MSEMEDSPSAAFGLRIETRGCADLEEGTVYKQIYDARAQEEGDIRAVDASGEDHLYPPSCFVAVDLPTAAREALGA